MTRKIEAGKTQARKKQTGKSRSRWSQHVTQTSNAMDLEPGVFASTSPKQIAASLKHSAEVSNRRKASPFQSAMSMLNLYINRAGHNLPDKQKTILTKAKDELRKAFGRE